MSIAEQKKNCRSQIKEQLKTVTNQKEQGEKVLEIIHKWPVFFES